MKAKPMKKHSLAVLGSLVATMALLLAHPPLSAQTLTRYEAQFGSKVSIDGTSTVHDWTVEGQIIGGYLELDPAFSLDPAKPAAPGKVNAKVTVTIPVRSLKSGKTSMDAVMQEAMKMPQFSKIEYVLTELVLRDPPKTGEPMRFNSNGELTVSGVKKTIGMPVGIESMGEGKLKVTGTVPLKMTAFGIKPPAPKLALGLITTGDDVKITFTWIIAVPKK